MSNVENWIYILYLFFLGTNICRLRGYATYRASDQELNLTASVEKNIPGTWTLFRWLGLQKTKCQIDGCLR